MKYKSRLLTRYRIAMALGLAATAVLGFLAPARASSDGFQYQIAGVGDYDGDGYQDIVARDLTTDLLYVYPGTGKRGYGWYPRAQIGNGWGWNYRLHDSVTDWDGDGHQDIVTYEHSTDRLWLYPGESKRGYSSQPRVEIGRGFATGHTADWDGDGHQDIVTRDKNGLLWLYPGESKRGYSSQPRVQIGNGWTDIWVVGIADWDRDGHQDLLAQDNSGLLWLYPGTGKRGYGWYPRVQIGNGWNAWPGIAVCGVTDWDRDGHQDILAVDGQTGLLWLYPGESKRGYSSQPRVQIGNGWWGCL
ncbi:VCBS repeat-containing protein [Microtetraspora sp. NBRC 16547]|uniref:FG-GAP repeat domain-containing protein n=1 Tax=Microtetraspora sp. NBRC 16547 TaxID=3030993 RepID=UPI00249FAED1|nr:VCBS repeat-containing protein [Microtetraspora sp. NBRC 16547]GLW98481.1 hypothetical protein Misp02_25680 [Microtetraspora sp. NBRC 16547]